MGRDRRRLRTVRSDLVDHPGIQQRHQRDRERGHIADIQQVRPGRVLGNSRVRTGSDNISLLNRTGWELHRDAASSGGRRLVRQGSCGCYRQLRRGDLRRRHAFPYRQGRERRRAHPTHR